MRRDTHFDIGNIFEECEGARSQPYRVFRTLSATVLSCVLASCGFVTSDDGVVAEEAAASVAATDPVAAGETLLIAEAAAQRDGSAPTATRPSGTTTTSTSTPTSTASKPTTTTTTTAKPPTTTATPATPTTTPNPTTPVVTTAVKINSIDEIVADMAQMNEGALFGVNPAFGFARGPGYVMMGNDPRSLNTPSWFDRSVPGVPLTQYWNAINPWFVFFEGVGNSASNSRVHLRNYKAFWKSRADGQWRLWAHKNEFDGQACYQGGNYSGCAGGDSGRRAEPEGGQSFKLPAGMNYHGWFASGPLEINGPDIAAVFVTMQIRLAVDNPAQGDDRQQARYLAHIGADYYPSVNGGSFGAAANPGVGVSRSKYLTNQWRAVSMTTFSDVGQQEPGGGITRSNFVANPPPLD
jgi:hypothetical protein